MLFVFDSLTLASILIYAALWTITIVTAPRRDAPDRSTVALLLAGTLLSYSAGSIWIFFAGWLLTSLPSWLPARDTRSISKTSTLASLTALVAGAAILSTIGANDTGHWAAYVAFSLLVLAALLRGGIFPFQFATTRAFNEASLTGVNLFVNSQLGLFLLIRFAIPQLTTAAQTILPTLSIWTLGSALYAALVALTETRPRRILGLLWSSQAALILTSIASRTPEAIGGALLLWCASAFATTGLLIVYRALEARTTEVESPAGFLGLGIHAPRLAIFFAVCGLALIGLPGTLGFIAEDLISHAGLSAHPLMGFALLLTSAFNAVTILRLFSTLFLGRRAIHATPIPDAKPKERWCLTAIVVVLIAGGLTPSLFLAWASPIANWLAGLLLIH